MKKLIELDWLQNEIIGNNTPIPTPYGFRPLVYADYTASGRGLKCIERALQNLLKYYANTHTDDDYTGRMMTHLHKQAEHKIKTFVNAGPSGKVIAVGTGATGALQRLATILGLYFPPVTRKNLNGLIKQYFELDDKSKEIHKAMAKAIEKNRPIVFVGPYEHHSNEIMWRESLCEVIEISLNKYGELDLEALEKAVSDPKYDHRLKIGTFSAASNVTGILTPVFEVAKILHKHNTLACFDYAASAPYVEINMNHCEESYFDAVVFSPHKFIGGPGSSGILVFNEKIYNKELPPSVSGGGTVCFVTETDEKYLNDIEEREMAGTPGILQTIKASLAMEVKHKVGVSTIHNNEMVFLDKFFKRFENNPGIRIYGPKCLEKKINILPFNIVYEEKFLHPKFVTKLLSELFGIQTRAGCSCAGPYGHKVLSISDERSKRLTDFMERTKYYGLKPGWVRINLHYAFQQEEVDYIFDAIDFVITHGHRFLSKYCFDFFSGDWKKTDLTLIESNPNLCLDDILNTKDYDCDNSQIPWNQYSYEKSLQDAHKLLKGIIETPLNRTFDDDIEEFMFFPVENVNLT